MNRQSGADERGSSLVELMVVVMLLSIVGVMLFSFLWSVVNTTTRATSDSQAEKAIELTLRPLTEDIRSTSTIATTYPATSTSCASGSYPTGYSNCLSITIARPTGSSMTCGKSTIVYGLKSDGILREDRTDYAVVGGVCTAKQLYIGKKLLTNIANGATPLFTYFDALGNRLDPSTSTIGSFSGTVTIRVSLKVQYKLGAPLLSYTSDLAVRNNR
jgi:type II secretory pathway pseudopilin PulG